MRVGIDVSPFVVEPRRGVARALAALLIGLDDIPVAEVVRFGPPDPLAEEDVRPEATVRAVDRQLVGRATRPDGAPREGRASCTVATGSPRGHRRRCRRLAEEHGIDVWYSPWSAFPDVDCPVVVTVHELPFVRCGPIEGRVRAWRHRRWLARDVASA